MSVILDNRTGNIWKPCIAVVNDWCSSLFPQSRSREVSNNEFNNSVHDGDGEKNYDIHDSSQDTDAQHNDA